MQSKVNLKCPFCNQQFDDYYIVKLTNEKNDNYNHYFCSFCMKEFKTITIKKQTTNNKGNYHKGKQNPKPFNKVKQTKPIKQPNFNKEHTKELNDWFNACKEYVREKKKVETLSKTIDELTDKYKLNFVGSNFIVKNRILETTKLNKPNKEDFIKNSTMDKN